MARARMVASAPIPQEDTDAHVLAAGLQERTVMKVSIA